MIYYTCKPGWENMLTCIYDAWSSRKGHKNIKLLLEPIDQYTLFDEYIHVEGDTLKAEKLMDAINDKLSAYFYRELMYASMAYEEDVLDTIYRCLILGFAYGNYVLSQVQYRDIMRFRQIRTRVGKEVNHFQEFIRFHRMDNDVYVAHFEPKSRIAVSEGYIFQDRMPSENWIIVDDIHREAVIHPKDQNFYLQMLSPEEYADLLKTEDSNDRYTQMWKNYFDTIAIEQRRNIRCQDNLFPKWTRKHVVEFNEVKYTDIVADTIKE